MAAMTSSLARAPVASSRSALQGTPLARHSAVRFAVRAPLRVRAEAEAAAETAAPEKAAWTAPTLDSNMPSPIFGGSTGGLMNKAKEEEFVSVAPSLRGRDKKGAPLHCPLIGGQRAGARVGGRAGHRASSLFGWGEP